MVKLWTNATIGFEEKLFSGAALSVIDGGSQAYNPVDTRLCTDRRHKHCEKDGCKCDDFKPTCEWDQLAMVGKKALRDKITSKDIVKIEKILNNGFKACRRVVLTLTDSPSEQV